MASALEDLQPDPQESQRDVLSTVEDYRDAVIRATVRAERSLTILTPDLEPAIYNHDRFLEALKRFVLARPFVRVRVLVIDPASAVRAGHRLVAMGRRLDSYIEVRNAKPHHRDRDDAFFIADDTAVIYRARAEGWDGMSDTCQPQVARLYLDVFDQLWYACESKPGLAQLYRQTPS